MNINNPNIFASGYAHNDESSLCVLNYDAKGNKLSCKYRYSSSPNPSFLACYQDNLYVANENEKSSVDRYKINENGSLTFLSSIATGFNGLCHISVSSDGKYLLGVHYFSATLVSIRCKTDGSMEMVQTIYRYGKGPNQERQESSHLHSINFTNNDRSVVVCDLGTDEVLNFCFDSGEGTLNFNKEQPIIKVAPGEGPRFFVSNPVTNHAYVVTELMSNIYVYEVDDYMGVLKEIQCVKCLPADYSGDNQAADIRITRDGKYLYESNRGHDSITCFSINSNGMLNTVGNYDCEGKFPRCFIIEPSEEALLIVNQFSDKVVAVKRNQETGALIKETVDSISVKNTTCIAIQE
jgi:6-phosphogluconolactonase